MNSKKLIILDRDGVINHDSDEYIKSVDEWQVIEGSIDAIRRLKDGGFLVAVATNQSGIGRGYYSHETLARMHDKFNRLLLQNGAYVDGIFYCPHTPNDACDCRKPLAGLYDEIADYFDTRLEDVPVIGDSLRDLEAAESRSAKPILVKTGKGQRIMAKLTKAQNYPIFDSLTDAIDAILAKAV